MKIRFFLSTLSLLMISVLIAQEYRGTLSGSVTDQQNAAIAKAVIVAIESRTGTRSSTVSEESGAFTIPFLLPGEYEISAEAPGFKKSVRGGIKVSMGEHPVIDIKLEVGDVTQSVMVTADAPLIDSATGSIGQVITTAEVEALPVNGRTPAMLTHLALGVTSGQEPGVLVRPYDTNTQNLTGMGGAPMGASETLMNGSPNAGWLNQAAYSPPQDAVLEIRVNALDTNAAYGHSMGGTTNQITKGGTNSFHGSIYDFNQVSALAANSFFNNKSGIVRPVTRQNQYGMTAGAPIWIPKVVNGKNRIFWFFAFEGLRSVIPQPGAYLATVPTPAERQGNFSALLTQNKPGTDYTIYDPSTGVMSGTQIARAPFPNNVIPTNRLNQIALNYLKYYPQPNITIRSDGFQNYAINASNTDRYNNELGRLDFNISNKDKLYFDFRQSCRNFHGTQFLGDNNPASGQIQPRINWGSTLDDVYTVSPTTVIDARLNWTRFRQGGGNAGDGIDPTTLGFPAYVAGNSQYLTLPGMVFTSASVSGASQPSFQSLGALSSYANYNIADSFQLFSDVVKIHGNHTIKAGIDIREYRWSARTDGNSAGSYTFDSTWTRGPLNNSAAAPLGQDFAAFLLGLPTSGGFDVNGRSTTSSRYYSLFLQEDWRVRGNLTLNLGLRWEHETAATERFNRAVNGFDPNAVNSASAAAAAAYAANPIPDVAASQFRALGGLTFVGANSPDIYHMNSNIFSPRVGFAWTPKALGSKTVIRGGFGVFVAPIGIIGNLSLGFNNGTPTLRQPGFSQTTQFVATDNNYLSPASTLSDPFPNGILQPAGSTKGASTFLGQTVNFFNPSVSNPYSLRWDFDVERQLPGQMVLEVAYIGNHGVHLLIPSTNLNRLPRQDLSTSPIRDNALITRLGGSVANPFRGLLPNSTSLNGSTVALQQLLLPYPQFPSGGVITDSAGAGGSYYESLNVRLQKRFTHGLTLINNFTWNKMEERLVYLNDTDTAPENRISGDSRPLREVLAVTYRLPIGPGKAFDPRSRLWNSVLGGWTVTGVTVFQSGPALAWGNVIYYGGPLNLSPHDVDTPAFDISRFNTASAQQLSQNIRTFDTLFNNLRRDPSKNLDLSVMKEVPFGEQRFVQLRIESFNTTNRVTMAAPNLSPTASTFGLITTQANNPRRIQVGVRVVW